ncbi:MAG TPA: septal ring lytic transglycosylase RlpA family protein [Xanthobacteraceae bacterium]|nr:septal ring lytic transglycosylase RlpA family protein [Xanthobacteraceae bacterium]
MIPLTGNRRRVLSLSAVVLTAAMLSACAQTATVSERPTSRSVAAWQPAPKEVASVTRKQKTRSASSPGSLGASNGLASFYKQGQKTASGERFNPNELTAAHRTLPFGTRVRVTNVATGKTVTVRVNDRGPFIDGRVIDVSHSAAESLGMVGQGVAKVKLDVVD